jgi:hypothetical protein
MTSFEKIVLLLLAEIGAALTPKLQGIRTDVRAIVKSGEIRDRDVTYLLDDTE